MNKIYIAFLAMTLIFACNSRKNQTGDQQAKSEKKKKVKTEPIQLTAEQQALADNGKAVYNTYCLACHMEDGKGIPGMNPPLVDTEWISGENERLIKVVLNGMTDPIEIDGKTYSNIMAPHNFLSDEDIAGVLTFVRTNFGNNYPPISPEEVKVVRENNDK